MDYKKFHFQMLLEEFCQAKPSLESSYFKIGDTIYKDDLGKNEAIEGLSKNKNFFLRFDQKDISN